MAYVKPPVTPVRKPTRQLPAPRAEAHRAEHLRVKGLQEVAPADPKEVE